MTDLTKKELEEIELQAELEAEEELKAEAKAVALESAKTRIKAKKSAKEASRTDRPGTRQVRINLGKHSDRIVVDGRTYLDGRTYPLTLAEEQSINDTAFRTHLHQAELRGKNFLRDFYGARPSNPTI